MNQITIEGNLGSDPELKMFKDEVLASFSLAHTPRKKVNGQYEDGETIWFKVTFWNLKSDAVIENLKKGDKVLIVGKLNQSTYKGKDGEMRTSLEIAGTNVYAKLRTKPKDSALSSFGMIEDAPSW